MQKPSKSDLVNTRNFRHIFKESDKDRMYNRLKRQDLMEAEEMRKWENAMKLTLSFAFFFHLKKKIINVLTDPYRVRKKRECFWRLKCSGWAIGPECLEQSCCSRVVYTLYGRDF